ncbi:MAG TPA: sensor histidine kinase [Thermoleophilaceae bacterium]
MIHLGRPPIASREPVVIFAAIRLAVALVAGIAVVASGFPYGGMLALGIYAVGLPWAIGIYVLARRNPSAALHPLVAAGDLIVLAVIELLVPETYGAVRFFALFLIAAHGQFQGIRGGMLVAAFGVILLLPIAAVTDPPVIGEDLLAYYESLFVVCAFGSAWVGANLRTAETAGRLRARELTRRMIETENDVRRRVADAIHDGPVQELTSVDMMLSAAEAAAERGDSERATQLIEEARAITARNIDALRAELVGLGPQAYEGLSFEDALMQSVPKWSNRYDVHIDVDVDSVDAPPELSGTLFQITQEAVVNVGRHADATRVAIRLSDDGDAVELRVEDDGHGFYVDPLGAGAVGHIGLASMRERAELINGHLTIDSSPDGAVVRVHVPLHHGSSRRTRFG